MPAIRHPRRVKREKQSYNTQPLAKLIERELRFSYAAQLAAAHSVTLPVGFHPQPQPNQLALYLPANQLTVLLTYVSSTEVPDSKMRISFPPANRAAGPRQPQEDSK